MGIALDLYKKSEYEKGFRAGYAKARKEAYEQGIKIGLAQFRAENRVELDYLRKRLAELESTNGISPDESRASGDD